MTVGIFGKVGNGPDQLVRAGGSGVFVSPYLVLTARHLVQDLDRLEGRDRSLTRPFTTNYGIELFQITDPLDGGTERARWVVDRICASLATDLAVLQVSPKGALAEKIARDATFLPWLVEPPAVGSRVEAIGFPMLEVENDSTRIQIGAPFTASPAEVVAIYQDGRDRGMLDFPCFAINETLDHGYSGGPVVFNDQLCGVVSSGSSFDRLSYVASLWPLGLMNWENEFNITTSFGGLLDNGTISSRDWPMVRQRISKHRDDQGRVRVSWG